MKIITAILLAFLLILPGKSQDNSEFEFVGTITINGGDVLSYKLVFNQTNNSNINGYTITDVNGENQTKTSIVGKYDTTDNVLSFKEQSNVYTKIDAADSTFCYVTANKLQIRTHNGKKVITGKFKGLFPSGEACADGKISLTERNSKKKVKSTSDSSKSRQDSVEKADDSNKVKHFNKQQEMVLMSNEKLFIEYRGNELILEVWDGALPDDDKISIYLNDEVFKENITLTRDKISFDLPATEGKFRLKILALNLGRAGVNTVNFAVKDTVNLKQFSSKLNKGEYFDVEFSKE